jgi:hypothetical protein
MDHTARIGGYGIVADLGSFGENQDLELWLQRRNRFRTSIEHKSDADR